MHYTNRGVKRAVAALLGAWAAGALALAAPGPARGAEPPLDFTGWHLPLPAGEWQVSRGACGSAAPNTHACGYYEDRCALDLTPVAGSMLNVPVLAPADGQVFFLGTRSDAGLTVMLQHADGRLSALMHLARVVVAPDQHVTQGQVVAYAGNSGSSTRPHLHFHVQPNPVDRECVHLAGLDSSDAQRATVQSHNLAYHDLTLVDPPPDLPGWLPLVAEPPAEQAAGLPLLAPARVVLAPGAQVSLPVGLSLEWLGASRVVYAARSVRPDVVGQTYAAFDLPVRGQAALGEMRRLIQLQPAGVGRSRWLSVNVAVRQPAETSAGKSVVLFNPSFVSPANWAQLRGAPRLCWQIPAAAGDVLFRVMAAGPTLGDSGWITDTCWQAPQLPPGHYAWKVFVRNPQGYMNRTNQRPYVFSIK